MNPFDAIAQKYQAPQEQQETAVSPFDQITAKYTDAIPDVAAANSNTGSQDFNGLCQRFVEQVTSGKTGQYGTAIEAWQALQKKARSSVHDAQPGDAVYFTPNDSNEGAGHTGIYLGNNRFISATDNGVVPYDMNDWYKQTGQHVMGFIPRDKMKGDN